MKALDREAVRFQMRVIKSCVHTMLNTAGHQCMHTLHSSCVFAAKNVVFERANMDTTATSMVADTEKLLQLQEHPLGIFAEHNPQTQVVGT